uniref:ARAD1B00594p n=1 Tax=Blastobotrys adeninivorans TaxID=409370 RepID=A0A060T9N6_BLAAD
MSTPPFKNLYHSRKVAESASRACFVCYKPTSTVLVTPDGTSDFFYVCEGHLKDAGFATPQVDPETTAAQERKKALEAEIQVLEEKWKRYEAKKDKEKKKDKGKDKDKESDKDEAGEGKELKKEKSDLQQKLQSDTQIAERKPRVFVLHKNIYSMRLSNWRQVQQSKQTRQLLSKPSLFPKVPTHIPGQELNPASGNQSNGTDGTDGTSGTDGSDQSPGQGPQGP